MDRTLATAADAADSIEVELPGFLRTYRNGHIERLNLEDFVEPSSDNITGVSSKDVLISPASGLSARLYLPHASPPQKLPILIHFHGGGFLTGSPFSSVYHGFLNSLISKTGFLAVSVDYRLAPEHPLPAAYDDSWETLLWVFTQPQREPWLADFADLDNIFLAGDSAGANIAHQMGLRLGKEKKKVEGMALVQPFFWGKERIGQEGVERKGALLKAKDIDEAFLRLVCPGMGLDNLWLNPMGSGGFPGLGSMRVLVCVSEYDLIRDRGRAYYEKLVESSWEGEAEIFESRRKGHGFHFTQPKSGQAIELLQRLVSFFRGKGAGLVDQVKEMKNRKLVKI